MKPFIFLLCAAIATATFSSRVFAADVIFFWGDNAEPPITRTITETVAPADDYRSRAGSLGYGRLGVGDYGVTHAGDDRHAALAKPYDADLVCNLVSATTFRCSDTDGNRRNTKFLYFWIKGNTDEEDLFSYARVDADLDASSTATRIASIRQGAEEATDSVRRLGRGYYELELGAAVERESSIQTQASEEGSFGVNCNPVGVLGRRVQVRCTKLDGEPVDTGFRIIAVSGQRRPSHNFALFDVFKQSSYRDEAEMDAEFSRASDGSEQSVRRISEGRYRVRLGPSAQEGGHVQVTSMGLFGSRCYIVNWGRTAVTIQCVRDGEPAETPFSVMGATPLTGSVYPRP